MDDHLTVIITVISYLTGAWLSFKVFDYKKKGTKQEAKDDLLLWPLLLVFAVGVGTLLTYVLKNWLVGE